MKRKTLFWRGLGVLSFATLPLTTIACSSKNLTQDQQDIISTLTSEQGLNTLEKLWLEKVIAQEYGPNFIDFNNPLTNDTVKKAVKFQIVSQLSGSIDYLSKIADDLLKLVDKTTNKPIYGLTTTPDIPSKNNLTAIGMKRQYNFGYDSVYLNDKYDPNVEQTRIERISEILMSEKIINFSNIIYKYIIFNKFQQLTSAQYSEFKTKQNDNKIYILNSWEQAIEDENFLLTKTLVNSKLFFKWNVKENVHGSNNTFVGLEPMNAINDAVNQFYLNPGTVAETIGEISKNKKISADFWDLSAFKPVVNEQEVTINWDQMVGFNGVSTQTEGKNNLNFSVTESKKALNASYWYGFVQKENKLDKIDLVTSNIRYIPADATEAENKLANLTQVLGIMPIYNTTTNRFTLQNTFFANDLNKVGWMALSQNIKLFDEALRYFGDIESKGGKNIKLDIDHEYMRKVYLDMGNPWNIYVKK